MVKCNHCGADNSDKVRYCSACGYELPKTTAVVQPQRTEPLQVRHNNHWLAISIVIGVGIVLIALANYGVYYLYKEKKAETKRMNLVEEVSKFNRQCPMMVDQITRLDNVKVEEEDEVHYNYTLVNLEKESVDIDIMKEELQTKILNVVRNNVYMKFFRDQEVTFSYNYKDKNGEELFKIIMTPDQYQ